MIISVNGAERKCADGMTIAALMADVGAPQRGSAAVVDGEVLPRSSWHDYELRAGQVVELITAVQGG